MTMPLHLRKRFELHARQPFFQKRIETAIRTIQEFLEVAENPYISVSGGKDSSVLLHLCRRVCPELDAIYLEMGATYPQSEVLLQSYEHLKRIVVADWLSDLKKVGMRGKKARVSDELARRQKEDPTLLAEYDGHFYGLRAEESAGRRKLAGVRGKIFFRKTDGRWVCQPITHFSYNDVWAYIVREGIAYNDLYDLMWDRPEHAQRVASFTLSREANLGTVAYLKMTHPDLFSKIVKASEEFREFV